MPPKEPYFASVGEILSRMFRNSIAGQLMRRPTRGGDLMPTFEGSPGWAVKPVEGSESVVVSLGAFKASKGLPEPASDDYGAYTGAADYAIGQRVRIKPDPACKNPSHSWRYGDARPVGTIHIVAAGMPGFGGLYSRHARDGHNYWVTHDYVKSTHAEGCGIYGGWFAQSELEAIEEG